MPDLLTELRDAAAEVAGRARHVLIHEAAIPAYAASLPASAPHGQDETAAATREERAAFWLTLDAINFGSGWFPTLNKDRGRSGYHTIAASLRRRFADHGPWSAQELRELTTQDLARTLSQDPSHELMELFARSLQDLGRHVQGEHQGGFTAVVDAARGSAAALVERLAAWACFADVSTYDGLTIPFLKRAQIAAADLARGGVFAPTDLHRLTMFADNLVPHVLRLDGILTFDSALVNRIDRQTLIVPDSPEEVEIRACAVHAVERLVAQHPETTTAAELDQVLWLRGQQPVFKASPRHRTRTTAY